MVTETKSLTLYDLTSRFLQSRRYLSPKTMEYYQNCLSGLAWFARKENWPDPDNITREQIADFMEYVATEPHRWAGDGKRCTYKKASVGTAIHYGKVVQILFSWARDEDYIAKNPALRLRLPHHQATEVEPYSDEEVRAMLNVCDYDIEHRYRCLGICNKAIISVFIDTGLRLSELAGMRLSQLDPKLHQVRVRGKGSKMRVVPISGEARKALRRYLTQAREPGGDEVWKTDEGALSPHSIKIMVARLKRRAGGTSSGGVHRFRHYFATRCLKNGMDMNSLRLLLGHSTLYMVLRYTKFENVQRAIDEHPQFSLLDSLYHGGNHNHEDNWGWKH